MLQPLPTTDLAVSHLSAGPDRASAIDLIAQKVRPAFLAD